MRIIQDTKLDFKDVLIVPKRSTLSSRKEVILDRTFTFRNSKATWTGIPIIAANMDGVGTFRMAISLTATGLMTCVVKHYLLDAWKAHTDPRHLYPRNYRNTIVSTGIDKADWEKTLSILVQCPVINFLCIDVANGYSEKFSEFVINVKESLAKIDRPITIIAGNVVTPEMTEELILNGVDIVKVGIGPGSVCTTRLKTGVGYPQLSAIIECADAAHGLGGHIIADGGCTSPGDIAKAFGAGADFVMSGGMFAGHEEGGGELVTMNGKEYYKFYGMSSAAAMDKHSGGVAEYRSSEGKEVMVPNKGSVSNTVNDMLGGLRSACTYSGARTLKDLPKSTTFVRVTQQLNNIYGD